MLLYVLLSITAYMNVLKGQEHWGVQNPPYPSKLWFALHVGK